MNELISEENSKIEKPALSVRIRSWSTPIFGFLMLVVGLVAGYLIRPMISPLLTPKDSAPAVSADANPADANAGQPGIKDFVSAQTRHFLGDPNAPVTIIEFSDFQCPYCGRFAANAGRQIIETYVKSGKARFGYIHFAFLGPESQWAAEASECAADQDRFWEYHDLLFVKLSGEERVTFSKNNLKKFAGEIGLDQKQFDTCLDEGKFASVVSEQTGFSRQLGVQSTPSFLVNNRPLIGAQPFSAFQELIEAALDQ